MPPFDNTMHNKPKASAQSHTICCIRLIPVLISRFGCVPDSCNRGDSRWAIQVSGFATLLRPVTVTFCHFCGRTQGSIHRALTAFLQEQRRAVMQARLELLAPYGVKSVEELATKIEAALVPEHPAWEDLIVAENLDARLAELDLYLRDL